MIKENVSKEVLAQMQKNLTPQVPSKKDWALNALAHLDSAATLLDDLGYSKLSENVTNLIIRLASEIK